MDNFKCSKCGETERIESGVVFYPMHCHIWHCLNCGETFMKDLRIIDEKATNELIDYIEKNND